MTKKLLLLLTLIFSLISIPANANSCNKSYLHPSSSSVDKVGTIDVQILFLKYPDSKKKPKNYTKDWIKQMDLKEMNNYVKQGSQGKAKVKFHINYSWINMPNKSYNYGIQWMMTEEEENNYRDAIISQSISKINPNTDVIWAIPDPEFSPFYTALRNPTMVNNKNTMVVMYNELNPWLAISEVFHGLGLRDLYSGIGIGSAEGGMDQFSLMAQYNGGTNLTGFEKYSLGWIDTNDVICQETGSLTVKLNSLDSKGTKLILLPINAQEMLAIEYRKKEKRDIYLGGSGIIIYHIDVTWKEGSPMNLLFFGKKGNVNFANINIDINKNIVTVNR